MKIRFVGQKRRKTAIENFKESLHLSKKNFKENLIEFAFKEHFFYKYCIILGKKIKRNKIT